jgi:hypothetical protein
MKTLSIKAEKFINSWFAGFNGDGKYYTTTQGSRKYANKPFQTFVNKHPECVEIIESGNDAPRGGRTGDFVVVKFTETFYAKFGHYVELKQAKEQAKIDFAKSVARSREVMIDYINDNRDSIQIELDRLDHLKEEGEKDFWQVNANSLVQRVSKNDFRALKWKEIYNLIRETV